MKVIWSPKAKESLKKVARYIFLSFGEKPAEKFKEKVLRVEKTLAVNPNIGPKEPLLENYSLIYRSVVVNKINKIVYYTKDNVVYISAFWDTRREPKALVEDLEEPETT